MVYDELHYIELEETPEVIMSKPGKTGIARIYDAFFYSMKGFSAAWKFEAAFRQELMLVVLLAPFSFWLAKDITQWLLLIASLFWVLMAELANSAVEAVVDRTGTEKHTLSGRAKDIGSALVFLSLVLLTIVWLAIIYNRFW